MSKENSKGFAEEIVEKGNNRRYEDMHWRKLCRRLKTAKTVSAILLIIGFAVGFAYIKYADSLSFLFRTAIIIGSSASVGIGVIGVYLSFFNPCKLLPFRKEDYNLNDYYEE